MTTPVETPAKKPIKKFVFPKAYEYNKPKPPKTAIPIVVQTPTEFPATNLDSKLWVMDIDGILDKAHFVYGWYTCPPCGTSYFSNPSAVLNKGMVELRCVHCKCLLDYMED